MIIGSNGNIPATVDLSSEGLSDWAHWGMNNANSYDHKAGVVPAISNFLPIGGNGAITYQTSSLYNWSGGTPSSSTTGTPSGVYIYGVNNGFEINVPADTTQRTLKLYVGVWEARGKLQANLSDGSAAAYVDTSMDDPSGAGADKVYIINYQAASNGQRLTLRWTVDTAYHVWGNVTLQAATLY
jgi:hypothetical protein